MPFITELIPEADRKNPALAMVAHPISGDALRPYKWAVDRERNIFFIYLGSGGPDPEAPGYYVLCVQGDLFYLRLSHASSGNANDGFTYTWSLAAMSMPEGAKQTPLEIAGIVKEALEAFGDAYQRDHIRSVNFNF